MKQIATKNEIDDVIIKLRYGKQLPNDIKFSIYGNYLAVICSNSIIYIFE